VRINYKFQTQGKQSAERQKKGKVKRPTRSTGSVRRRDSDLEKTPLLDASSDPEDSKSNDAESTPITGLLRSSGRIRSESMESMRELDLTKRIGTQEIEPDLISFDAPESGPSPQQAKNHHPLRGDESLAFIIQDTPSSLIKPVRILVWKDPLSILPMMNAAVWKPKSGN
jgi:hypothetical protein